MTQIYRISQKIIGLGQIWAKKCPKSGQNRAYSELKIIFFNFLFLTESNCFGGLQMTQIYGISQKNLVWAKFGHKNAPKVTKIGLILG